LSFIQGSEGCCEDCACRQRTRMGRNALKSAAFYGSIGTAPCCGMFAAEITGARRHAPPSAQCRCLGSRRREKIHSVNVSRSNSAAHGRRRRLASVLVRRRAALEHLDPRAQGGDLGGQTRDFRPQRAELAGTSTAVARRGRRRTCEFNGPRKQVSPALLAHARTARSSTTSGPPASSARLASCSR